MSDVLEHLSKNEALQVLKAIYHHLNPQGKVIIRVPNLTNPFNSHIHYGDFSHEIGFTTKSLQQVLQVTGFNVLAVKGEFNPHTKKLKKWFFDQVIWSGFCLFMREVMHLDQPVVRGKNLIAVGVKG